MRDDTVASNNFGRSRQSVNISGRYASERAWVEGARKSASLRSLVCRKKEHRPDRRCSRPKSEWEGRSNETGVRGKKRRRREKDSLEREREEKLVCVPGNGQRTEIKGENKERGKREREGDRDKERRKEKENREGNVANFTDELLRSFLALLFVSNRFAVIRRSIFITAICFWPTSPVPSTIFRDFRTRSNVPLRFDFVSTVLDGDACEKYRNGGVRDFFFFFFIYIFFSTESKRVFWRDKEKEDEGTYVRNASNEGDLTC